MPTRENAMIVSEFAMKNLHEMISVLEEENYNLTRQVTQLRRRLERERDEARMWRSKYEKTKAALKEKDKKPK